MNKIVGNIIVLCLLALTAQAQTLSEKDFKKIVLTAHEQNYRQVTLYACTDYAQAAPGEEVKVGLLFRILKGWNIYTYEKGSNYLPTEVKWKFPEGCRLVKTTWQKPVKLFEDMEKQGYFDYCFVVATIRLGERLPETFRVEMEASWQVCDHLTCVPGEGNISVELKVGKKEKTEYAGILKKW